jgi:hypothetical protein
VRAVLATAMIAVLLLSVPTATQAQTVPPCALACPSSGGESLHLHDAPGQTDWSVKASVDGQYVDFSGSQNGSSDSSHTDPIPTGPVDPNAPPPCVEGPVRLTDKIRLPSIDIQTSPEAKGVVNVPTWFWVGGYHGAWLTTTANGSQHVCDGGPHEITVGLDLDIWPESYKWDFGDGDARSDACPDTDKPSDCAAGLGSEDSPRVSHTYRLSSYQYGDKGGFPVLLSIGYRGRITTHEGTVIATFTIPQLTYSVTLPVREVESVLVHQ